MGSNPRPPHYESDAPNIHHNQYLFISVYHWVYFSWLYLLYCTKCIYHVIGCFITWLLFSLLVCA